jgi:DnaK suppressor protein
VKADLELIRKDLELQLKEATSTRASGDAIHIQQLADPIDIAVQLLDRESALVRRLRSAIYRVEDGSYGICLECEEEIAPKRLKAMPWAELCIQCQERADYLDGRRDGSRVLEKETEAA